MNACNFIKITIILRNTNSYLVWVSLAHHLVAHNCTVVYIFYHILLFFLEWEMFWRKVVENIKTHFIFNNFFWKSCRFWDNVEKYYRAGQATDDNMVCAHCMLDTKGYNQTLRIYNTYCFSTATIVAQKRLSVTLYIHCVYCRLQSLWRVEAVQPILQVMGITRPEYFQQLVTQMLHL